MSRKDIEIEIDDIQPGDSLTYYAAQGVGRWHGQVDERIVGAKSKKLIGVTVKKASGARIVSRNRIISAWRHTDE